MADYRRPDEDGPRRIYSNGHSPRDREAGHDRDWSARPGEELRPWFGDELSRREDRSSRWDGPREAGESGGYYATGSYRTDDRGYHDRYRHRDDGSSYRDRDRDVGRDDSWEPRYSRDGAADEYYRAAREQRDDLMRYEAQSPGAEFERAGGPSWRPRERGGYWRQYEQRAPFAGRGPKDYQRSDDRVREEVCDRMTDDPMLDASDIVVQVSGGVVTLSGSVWSREQKRRAEDVAERVSGVKDVANQLRVSREANGHSHPASQPVSQAYGSGTPTSKSTSGTSA